MLEVSGLFEEMGFGSTPASGSPKHGGKWERL